MGDPEAPAVQVQHDLERVLIYFDTPTGITLNLSLSPSVAKVLARELASGAAEAE